MCPDFDDVVEQWNMLPDYPVAARIPADPVVVHFARTFCGAVAEAFNDRRPAAQFSRWLAPQSWTRLHTWPKTHPNAKTVLSRVAVTLHSPAKALVYARLTCKTQHIALSLCLRRPDKKWQCERMDILWPGAELSTMPTRQ